MSLLLCALLAASDPWIFVRNEQKVTMSGDLRDLDKAMKLHKKLGDGYLWFRHGGKEYVVQDGKLLQQIDEATRPDEPTAEAEAELDIRQEQLERHQARLDQHEEMLDQYFDEHHGDEPGLERAKRDLHRAQAELEKAQRKLEQAQEKLSRESERISKAMEGKMAELIDRALKQGLAQEVSR